MRTMTALPLTTVLSLVALCLLAAPTPLQASGNAKAAIEQVLHIQQDTPGTVTTSKHLWQAIGILLT